MITLSPHDKLASDPILRTFHIPAKEYLCYDASGYFSPISIKDQVIRVCTILEHAKDNGLISSKRNLLIIGGGIAGCVAALRAADLGIKAVLIDKNYILNNLVTNSLRVICPTQYDWTASHWNEGVFPSASKKNKIIPFDLVAGTLKDRTQGLQDGLDDSAALITQSSGTEMVKHEQISKRGESFLKVEYKSKPGIKPPKLNEFGMAISCTGFGKEKVFVDNDGFHGQEFWKIADHEDIIDDDDSNQKILICGSGDGALQDFLLLATTPKTVREIYTNLKLTKIEKLKLEDAIAKAEEKAKRKEIWLDRTDREAFHIMFKELHESHFEEVKKLVKQPKIQGRIEKMLRREKLHSTKFVADRIQLFFECDHFSSCYPLNRFVALLIAEYLKEVKGFKKIMTGHKFVESVDGLTHKCDPKNPILCAGEKHEISFWTQNSCFEGIRKSKNQKTFDTVIIRFGLNSKSLIKVFGKPPAYPGIQILPYSVP